MAPILGKRCPWKHAQIADRAWERCRLLEGGERNERSWLGGVEGGGRGSGYRRWGSHESPTGNERAGSPAERSQCGCSCIAAGETGGLESHRRNALSSTFMPPNALSSSSASSTSTLFKYFLAMSACTKYGDVVQTGGFWVGISLEL